MFFDGWRGHVTRDAVWTWNGLSAELTFLPTCRSDHSQFPPVPAAELVDSLTATSALEFRTF